MCSSDLVKEMIYLPGILPFFKIHVNQFLAQDDSPAANVTSRHVVGEGLQCHSLSFETFPFFN